MISTVNVTVPATTANLGPGFDCLGAALTLSNQFCFSLPPGDETVVITAIGAEAHLVTTDESNLAYQAFIRVYHHLKQAPPPVKIEIQLGVPLSRGLGSSATAIVGGLVGANKLAGSPLTVEVLMQLAIALEGHPDNVVPALVGGCCLSATGIDRDWELCEIPWHSSVIPIVAIPAFELSTKVARQVLPNSYSRADAVFNVAHLGLLLRGLETGNGEWLKAAMQDRIHQPYRQALIPGYEAVQTAALKAGAYGLVISGAGPTLLALANPQTAETVKDAIATAWTEQAFAVQVHRLQIDHQGAIAQTITK
ncbi:MAG: homoserine kinase [Stenomitos rutilans HA7619-LM2]|nr:homoserine kinase [Stenomitos rutilans HA7619-LM2]